MDFKILDKSYISQIASLSMQLSNKYRKENLELYLNEMFSFQNYLCFGLFSKSSLVGISSGWITVRLYSGKQLEIDNVVIDQTFRSKGLGKKFLQYIENWAIENNCKHIELNTYVRNTRSHKFYYNLNYSTIGFHLWKKL